MGNVPLISQGGSGALTAFQRSKLIFDFETFFDVNKDGVLTYKDFLWAKDRICQLSGWKVDCEKYLRTEALFTHIWTSLVASADTDHDGRISTTEWLVLWESYKKELVSRERESEDFLAKFYEARNPDFRALKEGGTKLGDVGEWDPVEEKWKARKVVPLPDDTILPGWLHEYLTYRFDLLDRTGDGEIDMDEYQYVLSEFGIRERDTKQAFQIFSQHGTIRVDFTYFVRLFEEYYLSDNPADLGNFVNGKLEFPLDTVKEEQEQEAKLTFEEQVDRERDDLMQESLTKHKSKSTKDEETKARGVCRKLMSWVMLNCDTQGK